MAQTILENDSFEVLAGTTPKGIDLVIVPTKTGLYQIVYRGAGTPPAFTDQQFTSLLLAKRFMENYLRATAAERAKEQIKQKVIQNPTLKAQRKAEALELKNGEVSVPDPEED